MKTVSPEMTQHLAEEVTTMARCCRVEWQDGTVLAFTDHDQDLTIVGERYRSISGFEDVAVQTHAGMAVDNSEILGAIDHVSIKPIDVLQGRWDLAQVRFFEVNWDDLSMGQLKLRKGWIGEITLRRQTFVAELRGLMQALARELGDLFTPDCQADLGDARCKVDLAALAVTGAVTFVNDTYRSFTDSARSEADGYFTDGVLTWLTGDNSGKRIEVRWFATNIFQLYLRMLFPIKNDDTYEVTPGCDKRLETCRDKYNNIPNMRAFPYIPGLDNLLLYPDAHLPDK